MPSPTAAAASEAKEGQVPSPRSFRRSWSTNSSACAGAGAPKCVCAPATHAGSFKCRLHRVSSPPTTPLAQPPPAQGASSTTNRSSVEAL